MSDTPTPSANDISSPIVVSLGGSLVVPDAIDVEFLKCFKESIEAHVHAGRRFLIVVGGGRPAREYQQAASVVGELSGDDADWLGIHCTRLNAQLLRTIFKLLAHPKVFTDPTEEGVGFSESIAIGAGWRPGWSTDFVAVSLAERIGAQTVINLSNTDHVYSEDPRENPNAEKFETLTWEKYRSLIPAEWSPGLSSPFDPIASKKAHELDLSVVILNGKNMRNFDGCVDGGDFQGTVISG